MLKRCWNAVLDLLYPPKCPVCRAEVEQHGTWCRPCLHQVLAVRQVNVAARHLRCLDSCLVLCDYNGGMQKLIRALKFRGKTTFAVHIQWLLRSYVAIDRLGRIDRVIPVPLHDSRLAERGYNQTEKIFRNWVKENGWVWSEDILLRIKPTEPLWELPLAERRRNIRQAFAVIRPELITGESVLLVDDILTSGTTMEECARTLKQAGASRVNGLAVAGGG